MKSTDERLKYILRALRIIEVEIAAKTSKEAILDKVVSEVGYESSYFSSLFRSVIGQSLAEYIRTCKLKSAYRYWLTTDKRLSQRATFCGIKNFGYTFKRNFDVTLEDTLKAESVFTDDTITEDDLREIITIFNNAPFVDSCSLENGNISFSLDPFFVLYYAFSSKTYILPKVIFDQMHDYAEDEKKLMLILFDEAKKNADANNGTNISHEETISIKMSYDQLSEELASLACHDIDNPYIMGDYCYFCFGIPELFFDDFADFVCQCVSDICFEFISDNVPQEYTKMVEIFRKCGISPLCTIPTLARLGEWSEDEVIRILWDMLRYGIARITLRCDTQ